jgi:hypothetical protein
MNSRKRAWITPLAALLLTVSALPAASRAVAEQTGNDSQIQAELAKSLNSSKFDDVHGSVQNGNVPFRAR